MAEQLIASDSFERTVADGWGSADLGGAWDIAGGNLANTDVAGGEGLLLLPSGASTSRTIHLPATPVRDSLAEVTYTLTGTPDASSTYAGLEARVSGTTKYRAMVWHRSDGTTWLITQEHPENANLGVLTTGIPNWTSGSKWHMKMETTGTDTVTVKAKVWLDGSAEPATWQLSHTDTPADSRTGAGASGIYGNRNSNGTTDFTLAYDDYRLTDLSYVAPEPDPIPRMYVGTRLVEGIFIGNGQATAP